MRKKSEVVSITIHINQDLNQIPLGVLLHDENKLDEMRKILHYYMKIVPTLKAEKLVSLPNGSGFDSTQFFSILHHTLWGRSNDSGYNAWNTSPTGHT